MRSLLPISSQTAVSITSESLILLLFFMIISNSYYFFTISGHRCKTLFTRFWLHVFVSGSYQSWGNILAENISRREKQRSWRTWKQRSRMKSTCFLQKNWLRGSERSCFTNAPLETWQKIIKRLVPRKKKRGRTDIICQKKIGGR